MSRVTVFTQALVFSSKYPHCWTWWCTPETPALLRLSQEGLHEFKTTLNYAAGPCLETAQRPVCEMPWCH